MMPVTPLIPVLLALSILRVVCIPRLLKLSRSLAQRAAVFWPFSFFSGTMLDSVRDHDPSAYPVTIVCERLLLHIQLAGRNPDFCAFFVPAVEASRSTGPSVRAALS